MNIWFAAAIPRTAYGGIRRVMEEQARELRGRGHRVRCIYLPGSGPWNNYLGFAVYTGILLLTRARSDRPDAVIARSSDGILAAVLSRLLNLPTKVLLHNHGWELNAYSIESRLPTKVVSYPSTWKARLVRFPFLKLSLVVSHGSIHGAISEARSVRRLARRYGRPIALIPNGVTPKKRNYWEDHQPAPPRFLCVGNTTWKKNLDHVIATFFQLKQHLREARLFLVGTGHTTQSLPRDASVEIVPSVPADQMSHWYRQCPYVISGSRYEGGHSLALLEGMAHGCVVFATAIPTSREIVHDGRNGILLGGTDPGEDAQIIRSLITNHDLYRSVSREAFSSALRKRWTRQVDRLEKTLVRMIRP